MTGLKRKGHLTNSNYPHPHSNQEYFDKDGKRVLSGPLLLKKQNESVDLPKIHLAKPVININNRVECRISIKLPKRL